MVLPPPTCLEMGALYPVLGAMELTAELGYTTGWTMRIADTVSCRWFEGEKPQETVFDVALLEKVSARASPPRDRTKLRVLPARTP